MKNLSFLFEKKYVSIKNVLMILTLMIVFFSLSCSKDEDDNPPQAAIVYNEENPLDKYHNLAGFTTTSNFVNSGNYEFGLTFSPNVKGKINALVVKLPDLNPNLKITIWDFDTKTVLRTEMVNVATVNTVVVKSIPEMMLEKDKKYVITMNSNDWYKE